MLQGGTAEIRGVLLEEVIHELSLEYGLTLDKWVLSLHEQKAKAGRQDVGGTLRFKTLYVHSLQTSQVFLPPLCSQHTPLRAEENTNFIDQEIESQSG